MKYTYPLLPLLSGLALFCVPLALPAATPAISAGQTHTLALDNAGRLWSWGGDNSGQLGQGRVLQRLAPGVVSGLENVRGLAIGASHSLALAANGRVLSWGREQEGQLGERNGAATNTPAEVQGVQEVVQIAAGTGHSLALDRQGRLWGWGNNSEGQLTTPPADWVNTKPVQLTGLPVLQSVVSQGFHALALDREGRVWSWGHNTSGQLGDGSTDSRAAPYRLPLQDIVQIATGDDFSMALQRDGTLWAWGSNFDGQLGDGSGNSSHVPVKVKYFGTVLAIRAGDSHALALRQDGTVWGWGANSYGQLGLGDERQRPEPQQIPGLAGVRQLSAGEEISMAANDETVWVWGRAINARIGDDVPGARTPEHKPVPILRGLNVRELAAGSNHMLLLKRDGQVLSWGDNFNGQLGVNNPVFSSLPQQIKIPALTGIAAGFWHSAALAEDGTVWTWGNNNYGQLGDGERLNRPLPFQVPNLAKIKTIAAGAYVTLAVQQDGSVWQWGRDAAATTPVRMSGLGNIKTVAAGLDHRLALRSDGMVWSWGGNAEGQLGIGHNKPGNALNLVPNLSGVTALSAGLNHSVALRSDGTVYVWGGNDSGQLGQNDLERRVYPEPVPGLGDIVAISAGERHTIAVARDGTVWGWGSNRQGQLGGEIGDFVAQPRQLGGIERAVQAAAGREHSVALRSDGLIQMLGGNLEGQLGDGTLVRRRLPVLVVDKSLRQLFDIDVSAANHSLVAQQVPPFLVKVVTDNNQGKRSLSVTLRLISPKTRSAGFSASGYNLYVGARLPNGEDIRLLPPEQREAIYQRLPLDGWVPYVGGALTPMLQNILLGSVDEQVTVLVLSDLNVEQFMGAYLYLGYGISDVEMLQTCRLRTIFVVTQPDGNVPPGKQLPYWPCGN